MALIGGEPEASTHDYFRVDLQSRLPAVEVHRRRQIKERLDEQYQHWKDYEQQRWSAISQPDTVAFLGLNWSTILPALQSYIGHQSTSFALLAELHLCTIPPADVSSCEGRPDTRWLHEQYRRYAIRIHDYGSQLMQYHIPLIDATVAVGKHPILFEAAAPNTVSMMLPLTSGRFRLAMFPQTRYSFIEDEIFQAIYPLPEEQVSIMSHKLLSYFQGSRGHYNTSAVPFTELFHQQSYDGEEFEYFAALYPVMNFEFSADYEARKRSERLAASMQEQDRTKYPKISQWKYSRRFDFADENHHRVASVPDQDRSEGIHSARGLFEYSCGELDTLRLDLRQASLGDENNPAAGSQSVLVVDPLWLLVFPRSRTICAFRNESTGSRNEAPFEDTVEPIRHTSDWPLVLLRIVNEADESMGSYEPIYRTRLAKLQFRIHEYNPRDYALVKSLSEFVTELTILLDPLQAQIKIIKQWYQWYMNDKPARSPSTPRSPSTTSLFEDAIKTRENHYNSLKRLQERARESQALLFQLSNIETARHQSQLARKMAQETTLQVALARKAERQNKAILIFTIITVVFLPLSFFTSYFGMNTSDVREMDGGQGLFWAVAGPLSFAVIALAMIFAFRDELEHLFRGSTPRQTERQASLTDSELGIEEIKRD
ncbi:hypothetical protein MMC11_000447 [Xylographa trunciseda]|nr:hypothetical protein [Xylographa trunciseda]